MDVIELTRQLGTAIQADDRYKKFVAAKEASDKNPEVAALMDKIDKLRTQYQAEATKESPDENLLGSLDKQFQDVYQSLMSNSNMKDYEAARQEIDAMMNYLMQILYLCVNGEDPKTCEPQQDHGCSGECSCCSGC